MEIPRPSSSVQVPQRPYTPDFHDLRRFHRLGIVSTTRRDDLSERDLARARTFKATIEPMFEVNQGRLITDFEDRLLHGEDADALVRDLNPAAVRDLIERTVGLAHNARVFVGKNLSLLGRSWELAEGELRLEHGERLTISATAILAYLENACHHLRELVAGTERGGD